jgi:hypothetical protein
MKQAFFCRKWNTKGHTTPVLSPMTTTMIVAASIGLLQQSSRKDVEVSLYLFVTRSFNNAQ